MTENIKLPGLHPSQRQIVDHPARFKVLACGRRFGKTQTALEMIVDHLLKKHAVAYFAPTQSMSLELWEAVKRVMFPAIARIQEDESRIELVNGGLFECWTGRNETVRGRRYHFVVVDEAALIPDASLWQAVIRPLLTDYRGGALFASTPRGRNWFWQLYMHGLDPAVEDWQSWTFPTSANPHLLPTEIEDARRELPDHIFQQEYLARFIENAGMVFRGLEAVCTGAPIPEPQPGQTYIFGVDWARDNDFTAISVMAAPSPYEPPLRPQRPDHYHYGTRWFPHTDNPIRQARQEQEIAERDRLTASNPIRPVQVYLDRFNQVSYNLQRDRLKWLYDRYQPCTILAEANSIGAVNIDALAADGLPVRPFNTTLQTKAEIIERLSLAIERQELTLLNDPVLMHELQTYEMQRTASGNWHYSAPPGDHDDTVIATALSDHSILHHRVLPISFI